MHPRPGKFSHAEMAPVLDGIRGKQLPEAILVCNFPVPTATDAGLMDYGDVETFFHEFGHLMHHILGGQQQWAGISGITMESDFVEAPSQMLEEWIRSPQVLAKFARHYKTGEPIPAELVARMNRASAFGRGGWVGRQNSYSAISYDIYKTKPEDVDLDKVTLDDARRYTLFTPLPETHVWASFGHLGGYSSAYYTYLWDKVIAEDFFLQFDHKNLLAGDAPMRYRRVVLEPGGSMSAQRSGEELPRPPAKHHRSPTLDGRRIRHHRRQLKVSRTMIQETITQRVPISRVLCEKWAFGRSPAGKPTQPWKSGASAPRKGSRMNAGFSP